MPTLADRIACAIDEITLLRSAPAVDGRDAHISRANALEQQLRDAVAVLIDRGWM